MRNSGKFLILAALALPAGLVAADGLLGIEAVMAVTNKDAKAGSWSMEMGQYDAKGELMGPEFAGTMCIDPETMKKQAEMMTGRFKAMEADPDCKLTKGSAANGKFEYAIGCAKEGKTMSMDMVGTYGPEETSMTMNMKAVPEREGMPAKVEMKSKRAGDC